MTPPAEAVVVRARLEDVSDGDTYWLLLNFRRKKTPPWRLAEVSHVRLYGYGARESDDRAAADPKGLGRVTGPEATALARSYLMGAKELLVEVTGLVDRYGRDVCRIWTDGDLLGERLSAAHAVAETATMGLSPAHLPT